MQLSLSARVVLIVLVALSGAAAVERATTTAAASPARLLSFERDGLAFRYPAEWRRYSWRDDSSFWHSIVTLSTAAQRNPCVTTANSITCGSPLRRLEPGGVLVSWASGGMPGWRLAARPGAPARIGGRAARLFAGRPDETCAAIGGQMSIYASIARSAAHDGIAMDACLRAPRLLATKRQVVALLATVSFSTA